MSKATTVEKNNRFYTKETGEVITENEQLKEWLIIANESNDYFREENVRLINREKELLRKIHNKINEIERLNNIIKTKDEGIKAFTEDLCETTEELEKAKNIINKLEKWSEEYRFADIFKNKLQELKGSSKE